jgi:hypothetical protein
MRDLNSFSDETWDRFFEWLADDEGEDVPIEQVRADLEAMGIDMKPVHDRLRKTLEEHKNKEPNQ